MRKIWAVTAAVVTIAASGLISTGVAAAAVAAPIVINFTADTTGAKLNGFSSVDSPNVFFYDTIGANLSILNVPEAHGNGLVVSNDDASALEIRLASPTNAIRLTFGNDDSSVVNASDQAELKLFRNATLVGQVDVNVNANNLPDQTIGTAGQTLFNRATFQYVDAGGTPKNLIEVVDDIIINPLCTITGTSGNNHLVGTAGNDVICGDSGADTIKGGGGDDLIYGGSGNDHVIGGTGNDVIYGSSGKDKLSGGNGKDQLYGGAGRDALSGGKGKDLLSGGKGKDTCDGGKGRDSSSSCAIKTNIP
jgi:Ca2+-binding RTX toxin-like protein